MLSKFKNKCNHIKIGNSNVKNEYPKLLINFWKSPHEYYDPFEDIVFNRKYISDSVRIVFSLFYNNEYIELGNIQVQEEKYKVYYITAVNTNEYCRRRGVTNLLFSWVVLKLMHENVSNHFTIYIKFGSKVIEIKNSTGRFIYDKVFNNNKNVTTTNLEAKRVFYLEERSEDNKYFRNLYDKYYKNIIKSYNVIKEIYDKYCSH